MTAIALRPISINYTVGWTSAGNVAELTTPITLPIKTDIRKKILDFASLSDNWDGYGGVAPKLYVIRKAIFFLDLLPKSLYSLLIEDDIVCTPHGTIVFDLANYGRTLSIEIGDRSIGYFMEQNGAYLLAVEHESFNGIDISPALSDALRTLI